MENYMKGTAKQVAVKPDIIAGQQRNYNEVIEFLDNHWNSNISDTNLTCIKALDQALGSPSKSVNAILVGGTSGKSLTINFSAQLLRQEGLLVGAFSAPHMLTYNERISFNNEIISNKAFTEIANEVIRAAENLEITPNSFEILTLISLLYFKECKVDVALFEVDSFNAGHAVTICKPHILVVTRIVTNDQSKASLEMNALLSTVQVGTHVIAADQSKLHLQTMHEQTEQRNGVWAMPIRKLVALNYPFEQLHGRCAALAERVADIFINTISGKNTIIGTGSLLTKQKGNRGRPTLEAKRKSELNPKRTLEQFWKEIHTTLSGRFQILDKEKPSILLDNADNLDAFENLFLGIRLLHYQRQIKGLTLIVGCNNADINISEFARSLRYFFKKTPGQILLCPVQAIPGQKNTPSLDAEQITNDLKSMKIKARACKDFKEAFDSARKTVDERHGLLIITGSSAIISEYWKYKGIKKL